jgi:hypothetical protein
VHCFGVPPLHAPPWQVSPSVQAFESLQAVPLGFTGFEQFPLLGSQVPGM